MHFSFVTSLFLSALLPAVSANVGAEYAEEFHSFVTRPDFKPPKWNIKYHDKTRLAPGYWFVAPYDKSETNEPDPKWDTCQEGPMIYDNDGEPVWIGACKFPNHIVFDFKVSTWWDGRPVLTGLTSHANFPGKEHDVGSGFFLNEHYDNEYAVKISDDGQQFNKHEFNTLNDSNTVLIVESHRARQHADELGMNLLSLRENSFQEIDVESGEVLFKWVVNDHLSLVESTSEVNDAAFNAHGRPWDPWHMNSVDKNHEGDYLISLRHADMLVLVSGKNGEIKWRAGGIFGDFELLDGLIWSRQHHPRFLESTKDKSVISIMDNAKSGKNVGFQDPTHDFSRALIVQLNHPNGKPTTAQLLRHYDRPDGKWNEKRGSVQILPNDNVFATWTDGGYLTEFSADGYPLMEARWKGSKARWGTYRGYKFDNWVGNPLDRPVAASRTVGADGVYLSTIYVSWNGATEVASYDFWEQGSDGGDILLGRVNRTGFETALVTQGRVGLVRVDALDADGISIRDSEWVEAELVRGWDEDMVEHPEGDEDPRWRQYVDSATTKPWLVAAVALNIVLILVLALHVVRQRNNSGSRIGWIPSTPRAGDYQRLPKDEEE